MGKIKAFYKKYDEIIKYIFFGVLTTLVGEVAYFAMLWSLKLAFSVPSDDTTGGRYIAIYTVSQIAHWILAVLFAFFTNKKWVFTKAEAESNTALQLLKFSGGRVLTFFVGYLVTLFAGMGIAALISGSTAVAIFGREWNMAEIAAKIIADVIVIVCNYIFSKLFVFKNKE